MAERDATMLEWAGVLAEDRERLARIIRESADRIASAADKEYVKEENARIAMVIDSFNLKFFGDSAST